MYLSSQSSCSLTLSLTLQKNTHKTHTRTRKHKKYLLVNVLDALIVHFGQVFLIKNLFFTKYYTTFDEYMNWSFLIGFLSILIISSLIIAGIILLNLREDEGPIGELYTFPLSVEEQTYIVTVRSNYTTTPEVSYSGLFKMVSVNFRGEPENAFCNITIPTNLIWGEISLYAKGYKMNEVDYIKSSNSTHNSIYFTFNHIALVKTFDVKGTEGVITVP